jgi:hypothetical protein
MWKLFSDKSSSSRISSGVHFDKPNLSGMEGFTFQVDVNKWIQMDDLSNLQVNNEYVSFIVDSF